MIYALRIYHLCPGKLSDINRRFKDHTLKLFARHNIKVVDFWEDAEGQERIYYVCEFESKEQHDENFASFKSDPEWIEIKGKSEESGPIVERVESHLMTRVDYFKK